jgi:hypothetical protein
MAACMGAWSRAWVWPLSGVHVHRCVCMLHGHGMHMASCIMMGMAAVWVAMVCACTCTCMVRILCGHAAWPHAWGAWTHACTCMCMCMCAAWPWHAHGLMHEMHGHGRCVRGPRWCVHGTAAGGATQPQQRWAAIAAMGRDGRATGLWCADCRCTG